MQKVTHGMKLLLMLLTVAAIIVPLAGAADSSQFFPASENISITITHPSERDDLWVGDQRYPRYTIMVSGTIMSLHGIRNVTISEGDETKTCEANEITGDTFACRFTVPDNAHSVTVTATDTMGNTAGKTQKFSFRWGLPPPPDPLSGLLPFFGIGILVLGAIALVVMRLN